MDDLDYYLQLVIGKDIGLIFLCVFGAVLNSVMLYMLLSKKQVRSSVHTVYMVQIALTDLLVCAVWLVLTSVITHNLIQTTSDPPLPYVPNHTEDVGNNTELVYKNLVESSTTSSVDEYRMWRIMYSWYNFHYYTNIFLLASMSVERCAAVWKSMRCQRYQYNKRAIIGVSILMWILALAFVLPNLINPDLMVSDSDSPSSVSRKIRPDEIPSVSPGEWNSKTSDALSLVFRDRALKDNELSGVSDSGKLLAENIKDSSDLKHPIDREENIYKADLETLYECYTLMIRAYNDNRDYVRDNGNISVEGCFLSIWAIMDTYLPGFKDEFENNEGEPNAEYTIDDYYPDDYSDVLDYATEDSNLPENNLPTDPLDYPGKTPEIYNETTGKLEAVERHIYQTLLADAVKTLLEHHYKSTQNEACDPHLSQEARIYVLVVNLFLGFFVPFAIIVFSYISIAYMIGKRARSRMHPTASETSTTHFVTHYFQQNQSTTNIPVGAINMRDRQSRNPRPSDSMGRRMSDFMRHILLRKPQGGNDNRTYWTESDREGAPYDSMQQRPYSSSSKRYQESSDAHAKSDNGVCRSNGSSSTPEVAKSSPSQEENQLYDPELQEAIRQLNSVRMRHNDREDMSTNVNPRIKKYSFGDGTNENIPQTIEEHPIELEDTEDDQFLTASAGTFSIGNASPAARNHTALLMVQRNSRGSYGSSMDSTATDQTSLISSLHDKRYSAATTTSALTPPTPLEPCNPNSNAFFPTKDEKLPYNRSQSAESACPSIAENRENINTAEQRSPRLQKPGSRLNDIEQKLYQKSLQKKQLDEIDLENLSRVTEHGEHSTPEITKEAANSSKTPARERYSYPRMTRSKSAPEDRLNSVKLNARSTSRLAGEHQRDQRQSISQYPKYHRQNSSTSTVFFQRGRTYSTVSKGSMAGTGTLIKTMARKNAERHLRVSRTVLTYVIVFAICWLPQRITYLLYVIEALMGATDAICIRLISGTRLLSFISVLLNPIVYIMTQRDLRAYIRNTYVVSKLRHWYAKCSRKTVIRRDMESRNRPPTSDRNHDIEMQIQQPDDKELSSNRPSNGARSPYRMSSPPRTSIHVRKSSGGGQHEIFVPGASIPARQRDATIDEMKEEEAAAEESIEKEMERLAAEEKICKDDINKNWLESSEDDVISTKNTSGSGNKTTSSSSKSENFEEFWVRWLQSGGAELLSPPSDNLSSTDAPSALESTLAEFHNIAKSKTPTSPNKGISDSIL